MIVPVRVTPLSPNFHSSALLKVELSHENDIFAPVKFASVKSAPEKSLMTSVLHMMCELVRFAPVRSAPVKFPLISAPVKFAPVRSAPVKVPSMCAPVRFTPLKFDLAKFVLVSFAPVMFASAKSAPVRFVLLRSALTSIEDFRFMQDKSE